jgi:hypothetical protein
MRSSDRRRPGPSLGIVAVASALGLGAWALAAFLREEVTFLIVAGGIAAGVTVVVAILLPIIAARLATTRRIVVVRGRASTATEAHLSRVETVAAKTTHVEMWALKLMVSVGYGVATAIWILLSLLGRPFVPPVLIIMMAMATTHTGAAVFASFRYLQVQLDADANFVLPVVRDAALPAEEEPGRREDKERRRDREA